MGTRTCPACGAELPDQFRICGYCGAPREAPAPPAVVRKTVTIVFSDLAASTKLGEQLDSEALRGVMDRYFDAMRDALERHGGTVRAGARGRRVGGLHAPVTRLEAARSRLGRARVCGRCTRACSRASS